MKRTGTWVTIGLLLIAEQALCQSGAPVHRRVVDVHGHLSVSGAALIERVMNENGIEWMVNLSGGSPGRGMRYAIALANQLPGRIVNFYTPDWSRFGEPDFGELEAARLKEAVKQHGYGGLKISKHLGLGLRDAAHGLVEVDDPAMDPLWEMAGVLGVPVAIHVGDPEAFFEPLTPENERWDELKVHPNWSFHSAEFPRRDALLAARNRVLARHPRTTFICVHFGNNPEHPELVDQWLDTYPNMLIDISARVGEFGRHPAGQMRQFFLKHQDRILFGTDIGLSARGIMLGSTGDIPPSVGDIRPFYEDHWNYLETAGQKIKHPVPIQGNWTVDGIELPPKVLEKVYRLNAEKWIPRRRVQSNPSGTIPGK